VSVVVSTDVVVEASATLIAAILFLVTVRQALKLPASAYAKQAAGAVFVFISAIAAALGEDLFPAEWHWPKIATWVFFLLGLGVLAYLVYRLPHGK
jgi:hypothetical protein